MSDDLVTELARAFGSHGSLAKAAGVKHAAVSQWKRRRIPPGRKNLIEVAARSQGVSLPPGFYAEPEVNNA